MQQKTAQETFGNSSINRVVVMYAYYEKNEKYANNLRHFLKYGIISNIDYYIIVNGNCTVEIPEYPNISVVYRKNVGYDFGAWSHCITHYIKKDYNYYVFLNSSVRGPYGGSDWISKFIDLFGEGDGSVGDGGDVKLVGTSINVFFNGDSYEGVLPHVQTMFFILDIQAFKYLKNINFFNEEKFNKSDLETIVRIGEIEMSALILKNNWNINCILDKYKGHDYRKIKSNFNKHAVPYKGDPYFNGAYFGDTIQPHDVIFYKNNRNLTTTSDHTE
jgi:hypothetical protein